MTPEEPNRPDGQAADMPVPSGDDTPYDDEKTERAINDIVERESDMVLAAEDEKRAGEAVPVPRRRRNFFSWWWQTSWARWLTFLVVFGSIAGVATIPTSRYWVLNAAGVRVEASVRVVDDKTGLPLQGVSVQLAGQSTETNADGAARVDELRLGPQSFSINRPGFSVVDQTIIIGWGSNPLGTYRLKSTGVRFLIEVRDFLTNKPIDGVQAVSGESIAVSDKDGIIALTLASLGEAADPVSLQKSGYRSEQITLQPDPRAPTKALLVLNHKAVYVSKQSGKYDVYKSDLDGKNAQVLLPGTGSETGNISLAVSPDGAKAAVVATRDNQRDSSGALLNTLLVVDIDSGNAVSIAKAAQIQLIDWTSQRLIFEQVSSDISTPINAKYTVIAHSIGENTRLQLAAAKRLTVVFGAQGQIYYGVAADPADPTLKPAFYKVRPDGGGKQAVVDEEIWAGQRVDYQTFNLQSAGGGWLAFDLTTDRATAIDGPVSFANRLYADHPTRQRSLWVDSRDGQGILQLYDVNTAKESRVIAQGGLTYPVRWVADDVVIYRVVTGNSVSDYAVSLLGGQAQKIADVINTYGFTSGQ